MILTLIGQVCHGLHVLLVFGGRCHHDGGQETWTISSKITFYEEVDHRLHEWMAVFLWRTKNISYREVMWSLYKPCRMNST